MTINVNTYYGSTDFDPRLEKISHFDKFPEMMPWVGKEYQEQNIKILVIGESYFFKDADFHHDAANWYSRKFKDKPSDKIGDLSKRTGHRVRYHVTKSIEDDFKKSTHPMHRTLHAELLKTEYFKVNGSKNKTPFDSLVYLNYFQRPAERAGKSIKEKNSDIEVALNTIKDLINIVEPNIVMFASVKAYKAARKSNLFSSLNINLIYDYTAHPCSQHWNRACKKYGKIRGESNGALTGKKRFINVINAMTKQ